MQRVRAWRSAHPGYWKRSQRQTPPALQEDSLRQSVDLKGKSPTLTTLALQDLFGDQASVLIGLIANLTGLAQQEDIVKTGHRLQQLGRDILTGVSGAEGGCDAKTSVGPLSCTLQQAWRIPDHNLASHHGLNTLSFGRISLPIGKALILSRRPSAVAAPADDEATTRCSSLRLGEDMDATRICASVR